MFITQTTELTVPEASPSKTSKAYSSSQAYHNSTRKCRMCNCYQEQCLASIVTTVEKFSHLEQAYRKKAYGIISKHKSPSWALLIK
jgi:hypothetical protein